jgi:hypothetical protein
MDPNTSWEGIDVHEPVPEEVFVVSGTFNDGIRDYPAAGPVEPPPAFGPGPMEVAH